MMILQRAAVIISQRQVMRGLHQEVVGHTCASLTSQAMLRKLCLLHSNSHTSLLGESHVLCNSRQQECAHGYPICVLPEQF